MAQEEAKKGKTLLESTPRAAGISGVVLSLSTWTAQSEDDTQELIFTHFCPFHRLCPALHKEISKFQLRSVRESVRQLGIRVAIRAGSAHAPSEQPDRYVHRPVAVRAIQGHVVPSAEDRFATLAIFNQVQVRFTCLPCCNRENQIILCFHWQVSKHLRALPIRDRVTFFCTSCRREYWKQTTRAH